MNDDMRDEYDFSRGERGKFFRPGAAVRIPVYLNEALETRLSQIAERKGISLSDLVNDLLSHDLSIAESLN